MKKILLLSSFLLISAIIFPQYNQNISIDLSAGGFKTVGKKYTKGVDNNGEYEGPLQMPNYKIGFAGNGGFQFRLGAHLSLSASVGFMISNRWNYQTPDIDNWLAWDFEDTITGTTVRGENYLDLHNFYISVKPKYYLFRDTKWNPYLFAGVNINRTRAWFENNYWSAMKERGLLSPDDTEPWNDCLEESSGIGFNPGLGVEYSPYNNLHFYIEADYYFMPLKKSNFKDTWRQENFNAVFLQAGCRLNFIKIKEL